MARSKATASSKPPRVSYAPAAQAAPTRSSAVVNGPYSFASFINWASNNFVILFVTGIFFLIGFFAGSLWTENQLLKNGGVAAAPSAAAPTAVDPNAGLPAGPTADQLKTAPEVTNEDHIRGNKNAAVTLIEYSDYECPFCARFHPTMLQVMKDYGDKIRWVYRHYPLSFHPNAQKAAEGAECVSKLAGADKFWEYSDKMFEENNKIGGKLNPDTALTVATAIGVNKDAFQKCLDSGEMAAKVKTMMDGGTTAGITGTPGTIVLTKDGEAELISGAYPIEQVKATLDQYVQ